ncbi:hypothetical protein ANO11243_079120 [Dothideomycetidae sp. 11243]|nr:hypothetical protein ANO11243_079120 [fungal sp. No.11243]
MQAIQILRRQRSAKFNRAAMGSCMSSPPDIMPKALGSNVPPTPRSYQSTNTSPTVKTSYTSASDSSYPDSPNNYPQSLPPSYSYANNMQGGRPSDERYDPHYYHNHGYSSSALPRSVTLTRRPQQHQHQRSKTSSSDGSTDYTYDSMQHWPIDPQYEAQQQTANYDFATQQQQQQQQPSSSARTHSKKNSMAGSKFEQRMQKRDYYAYKMVHDETGQASSRDA